MDRGKTEAEKDARRLRELFRGRFDQDTAVKLIADLGGLIPAIDFLFNEPEDQVSAFLKQSTTYLKNLRDDSQNLASILENKIEDSVRQFVCGDCQRSWWQRVPLRKEVPFTGLLVDGDVKYYQQVNTKVEEMMAHGWKTEVTERLVHWAHGLVGLQKPDFC